MPLRKKVGYVGLKDFQYAIRDSDAISRDYFNIVEFPNRLTAGKNLFKLKTNFKLSMKDVTTMANIATAVKIY